MKTIRRLSAGLAAGAIAIALSAPAFGQADNTNSVIAPAMTPSYSQRNQYDYSRRNQYDYSQRYQYGPSRQAYIEDAGHQWDAVHGYREVPPPYVTERPYVEPYGRDASVYSGDGSRLRIGGPGLAVGQDSNPNDYATGVYNPKQ
jgi:hypothetical protein